MPCPALSDEMWMKIFMENAKQEIITWWNSLSKVQQEYEEWPLTEEEMAELEFKRLFGREPYEASTP